MAKKGPAALTAAHKNALAAGRKDAAAVKAYLEAIEQAKPKRGRPRTTATIKSQLDEVNKKLIDAGALERLQLTQRRMDLERDLKSMQTSVDITKLEAAFIKAAKSYSARKGISAAAWKELGVSAAVLKKAGIA